MNIELSNQESSVVDDFEGQDYLVAISSANIYIDDAAFGYYHAAWPNKAGSRVDIVMYVVDVNESGHLERKLAVALSVDVDPQKISIADLDNFLYEAEWCEEAGVLKPDEINGYTRAKKILDVAPSIMLLDEAIQSHVRSSVKKRLAL